MNKTTFEMATQFGYQSEAETGNVQQRFDNLREPERKPKLKQWNFDKCDMTKEMGDAIKAIAKARTALEPVLAIDKPKSFKEYLSRKQAVASQLGVPAEYVQLRNPEEL